MPASGSSPWFNNLKLATTWTIMPRSRRARRPAASDDRMTDHWRPRDYRKNK